MKYYRYFFYLLHVTLTPNNFRPHSLRAPDVTLILSPHSTHNRVHRHSRHSSTPNSRLRTYRDNSIYFLSLAQKSEMLTLLRDQATLLLSRADMTSLATYRRSNHLTFAIVYSYSFPLIIARSVIEEKWN